MNPATGGTGGGNQGGGGGPVLDASTGAGGSSGGAGGAITPPVKGALMFQRKALHMFNYAEAIGNGEFNKDGKVDVLSGPFWWEGPAFDKKHQLFPPPPSADYAAGTLGDWADYPVDVDGDGWVDSVNVMRPGTPSYWYKNPGMPQVAADVATWERNLIGSLIMDQSAGAHPSA